MRKGKAPKRFIQPDIKYSDVAITKFVNALMKEGKKSKAYAILYKAFDIIEEKTKKNGHEVFQKALEKVTPMIEVKSRRMRGATYQVPIETRPERKVYLFNKWMIHSARKRNEKSMSLKLAAEFIAASQGEGAAMKKKNEVYKVAQSNKSFSHFKF
ncbi:MAG: 30S ribosomal protein S7 [Bacteroidota bacterium]